MRALIKEAVGRVAPEEIGNIEEMMVQFEGNEEELLQALEAMGRGMDPAGGKRKVVSDGNTARSIGSARSFGSGIPVQPPNAGNGGVRWLFDFDWMKHKDASVEILKELESHQFPEKEVGAVERALVVEDNNSYQNELDNRDSVDTSAYLTTLSDDSSRKLNITSEVCELSELTTEPKSSNLSPAFISLIFYFKILSYIIVVYVPSRTDYAPAAISTFKLIIILENFLSDIPAGVQ